MFKEITVICLALVLVGCGTASTIVVNPIEKKTPVSGVIVKAKEHNVEVPKDIVVQLQEKIEQGLYEKNSYKKSEDLYISLKFLQQDKGNQLARWFWGGIGNSGEASLTVSVTYQDKNGNTLGNTQVQGKIGSGFFGGSFDEAITKAAEDIVEFTLNNFPKK